jgi:hypothetical protein
LTGSEAGWRASRSGLLLDNAARLSFQRYLLADAPPLPALPTSLGSLEPFAIATGAFLVPLHEGEAVWIGIELASETSEARVIARGESEFEPFIARGTHGPLQTAVAGLERPPGAQRFALRPCGRSKLLVEVAGRSAAIELISGAAYQRITGKVPPPPARPSDGYQGWRLP